MSVGDIYKVEVFYNIGSEITMNVMHWKEVTTSTDPIPAETVALMVHGIWAARYASLLFSQEASVTLIVSRRIKPTAGVPSYLIVGTAIAPAIAGSGVGDPLPSTSAALLSFYTDTHTRRGRGRMFLPGVASGTQNDGQFLAANLALLEAFGGEFENDHVAVGAGTGAWHAVVYSRILGTGQEIVQTVPHSNLATQRSRRNHPGLGV